MAKQHQAELIAFLLANGWQDDGQTYSETYKIITAKSYPLAGALVTTGGKPRFAKNGWKIGVGVNTTVIYRRPDNPETIKGAGKMAGRDILTFRDWEMYNIKTRDIEEIKAKLRELGLAPTTRKETD